MPYANPLKAWYGAEAIVVTQSCQLAFVAWLETILNDPAQPYQALLGREAKVFTNATSAVAAFQRGIPSVLVLLGPGQKPTRSGANVENVAYHGLRHQLSFNLDMGFATKTASNENPAKIAQDDDLLAGVVKSIVDTRQTEIEGLGLFNAQLKPDAEAQGAANKRNPQRLTFWTKTLDNYTPAP